MLIGSENRQIDEGPPCGNFDSEEAVTLKMQHFFNDSDYNLSFTILTFDIPEGEDQNKNTEDRQSNISNS